MPAQPRQRFTAPNLSTMPIVLIAVLTPTVVRGAAVPGGRRACLRESKPVARLSFPVSFPTNMIVKVRGIVKQIAPFFTNQRDSRKVTRRGPLRTRITAFWDRLYLTKRALQQARERIAANPGHPGSRQYNINGLSLAARYLTLCRSITKVSVAFGGMVPSGVPAGP